MQDDAFGFLKHRHVDDGAAGEGHLVEVRVQGEVIAKRTNALRQPELCPWKHFAICGQRVDRLNRSGLVALPTTRLQKDGRLGSARDKGMTENLKREII